MSALFSILLAVVVLGLALYPLYKGSSESFAAAPRRRSLADDKEMVMSTLGEIEFDYHMKKLSEEDYQTLKHNYSSAAVELLKAQEKTAVRGKIKTKTGRFTVSSIEQEIEAELAALDKEEKTASNIKCHRCGAVLKEVKQEYCHSCGERQF